MPTSTGHPVNAICSHMPRGAIGDSTGSTPLTLVNPMLACYAVVAETTMSTFGNAQRFSKHT